MDNKFFAWEYLRAFLLTPYKFGGDDFSGIDCSGQVVEWHMSLGLLPHKTDMSAKGLWEFYKKYPARPLKFGDLLFWGPNQNEIGHVTIALTDTLMYGAEGGDGTTQTIEDAIKRNAFVKIRPIAYRGVPVAIAHPPYPWE